MRKIKILNYLVIGLLLINAFWFIRHSIFSFNLLNDEELKQTFRTSLFKHYKFFVDLFFNFLVLVGIFFVQRALNNIIKKGAFNNKLHLLLKRGGLFFIISGFFGFIINFIIPLFIIFKRNPLNMFIGNDFLILIIGVSLYYASDIIHDGTLLKQENDLTI